ncbi:hypothetical protein [Hymenobacter cavernae]|uniref:DUF4136 domain-containing protein n=1 Tax=Hymenobacter cavernae TaxID=2044852 RepID=A0ABQ1U1N9_9BACT|nr:hypothetical protein [Hymenobacter cavernae]GGF06317.1 hypothetical protein GCM10011383_16720 [Hymenobacter cavernae]
MKKLAFLSLLLPLGLAVSFQVPKNNIRLVSTNLYTVSSVERMTTTDRDAVRKAIVDYYKLGDIRAGQTVVINPNDPRNKAGWIFSESVFSSVFSSKFINWKGKGNLPQEALRVKTVLNKYAARE